MKKNIEYGLDDQPLRSELVADWLNKCKGVLNISRLATKVGITKYRLDNVMAGKTELSEREAAAFIKWAEGYFKFELIDKSGAAAFGLIVDDKPL